MKEEHLAHIEEIFKRLKAADLKMKRSKCNFFKKHIHYLGHLISADGIQPLKDKLDMICDMPAPHNSKEVKQFLGLAGYYRKFVPCFADLSRPLARLTCKDKVFEWTHECKKAFDILKQSLCTQLILKYADTSKGYTLYTDASKYGWAGVLTQAHTSMVEGKTVTTDHPVAYVSGLFRGSQLNWSALTKEAFAIYMSVKKLSFYLTDADVLLKSDHLTLKKFLQKNPLNNKVNNWAMELEAFDIRFEHVSGKANILADMLSHLVDIDPDTRLDPENARWEFGYYICCGSARPPAFLPTAPHIPSRLEGKWASFFEWSSLLRMKSGLKPWTPGLSQSEDFPPLSPECSDVAHEHDVMLPIKGKQVRTFGALHSNLWLWTLGLS